MIFLTFSAFMAGGLALLSQILLIRQLLGVAAGNEWVLGIGLSSWLGCSALGSKAAARFVSDSAGSRLSKLWLFQATAFPCSMGLISRSHWVWGVLPGQTLSPGQLLGATVLSWALPAMLYGALFPSLCHQLQILKRGESINRIYSAEAAGSAAAGVLAGFLILPHLSATVSVILVSMTACAFSLLTYLRMPNVSRLRQILTAGIHLVLSLVVLLSASHLLNPPRAYEVSASKQSRSQHLQLSRQHGQITLFGDNRPLWSVPDPAQGEWTVHPALLAHDNPHSLLVLGGCPFNWAPAAQKHRSLTHITALQPDPAIMPFAEKHLPDLTENLNAIPTLNLISEQPLSYLKHSQVTFDVIVLRLPPPETARLSSYYSKFFFRQLKHHLSDSGVLCCHLPGGPNALSIEQARLIAMIRQTAALAFPYVALLPGESVMLFASSSPLAVQISTDRMTQMLNDRRIDSRFINPLALQYEFSPERQRQLTGSVEAFADSPPNTLRHPKAYWLMLLQWLSNYSGTVNWLHIIWVMTLLLFSSTGAMILCQRKQIPVSASATVWLAGASHMGVLLVILLIYQGLQGAVYLHLSVISGLAMLGLGLGAVTSSRDAVFKDLYKNQYLITTAILGTSGLLYLVTDQVVTGRLLLPLMMVLILLMGFLSGRSFGLSANLSILYSRGLNTGVGGHLYTLDLAGAVAAALLFPMTVLPLWGTDSVMALLVLLNAVLAATLYAKAKTE